MVLIVRQGKFVKKASVYKNANPTKADAEIIAQVLKLIQKTAVNVGLAAAKMKIVSKVNAK